MNRGARSLLAALTLLVSSSAFAVELNYKWKKGEVHRFRYEDDTTFEMKMPGMGAMGGIQMPGMNMGSGGMEMNMKVRSVFSQKVLSVGKDGTAQVQLTLERMELMQGGERIAALDKIPPAARKVKAEVDRKGNAKFYRMVTVYLQDERAVVGVHDLKAGKHGARASMSAGDTQVDVVAAVDPKSGSISLAMNTKKKPPALRAVKIKEEDPSVDVLPRGLFEMMVLPEGDLAPSGRYEVTTPLGRMAMSMNELEGNVAELHTRTLSEVTAPAESAPETGDEEEDLGEMPDTDMDMDMDADMDMGGMPGMKSAPGGKPGGASAGMDVDVTSGFDVAAGRLLRMKGSQNSEMNMGGMAGMKTRSSFTLQRL